MSQLKKDLEDALYAGRLITQRCDRLVAERDALRKVLEQGLSALNEIKEYGAPTLLAASKCNAAITALQGVLHGH